MKYFILEITYYIRYSNESFNKWFIAIIWKIPSDSVVSRALAKLENKNLDDSDIIEPSEKGSSGESTIETAAVEPAAVESAVVEASNKVRTPNKPNTTAEDSMFIRNNMAQIQSDLSEMRNDVIAEEDKEEEEEENGQEEEEHQQDEKENDVRGS